MGNFLGVNLKYLRKKNGKSQADIGIAVSKGATTIGNWEGGISEPNLTELEILTNYFGVSANDFLFSDMRNAQVLEKNQLKNEPPKNAGNSIGNVTGNAPKQHESAPNSAPNSTPNSTFLPTFDATTVIESLKAVIAAKDQTISSQALALQSLQSLLDIKNQEVEKFATENAALKRELPGSIKAMRSTPGKTKATKQV